MECPRCGYLMDALSRECPRCAWTVRASRRGRSGAWSGNGQPDEAEDSPRQPTFVWQSPQAPVHRRRRDFTAIIAGLLLAIALLACGVHYLPGYLTLLRGVNAVNGAVVAVRKSPFHIPNVAHHPAHYPRATIPEYKYYAPPQFTEVKRYLPAFPARDEHQEASDSRHTAHVRCSEGVNYAVILPDDWGMVGMNKACFTVKSYTPRDASNGQYGAVGFFGGGVDQQRSPEENMRILWTSLQGAGADVQLLAEGSMTATSGTPIHWLIYTMATKDHAKSLNCKIYVISIGENIAAMNFFCAPATFSKYEPAFDVIAGSFRFE